MTSNPEKIQKKDLFFLRTTLVHTWLISRKLLCKIPSHLHKKNEVCTLWNTIYYHPCPSLNPLNHSRFSARSSVKQWDKAQVKDIHMVKETIVRELKIKQHQLSYYTLGNMPERLNNKKKKTNLMWNDCSVFFFLLFISFGHFPTVLIQCMLGKARTFLKLMYTLETCYLLSNVLIHRLVKSLGVHIVLKASYKIVLLRKSIIVYRYCILYMACSVAFFN